MHFIFSLLIIGYCGINNILSAEITEEEGVLVLNTANFDDALKLHPVMLVEFYAPWCGHCKALAPEYVKAAKQLLDSQSNVKLAKVDATVETKLAELYKVQGYPSLKFFKSGPAQPAIEFNGGRTADQIVSWIQKKLGPATTNLATVEALENLVASAEVVVVGFFTDLKSVEAVAFQDVASSIDDVIFGISSEADILTKYNVSSGKKIILFKKFDERQVDYEEDLLDKAAITVFIKNNQLPLFVEFNQDSAQKIFGGDIKKHFVAFISKKSEDFASLVELFGRIGAHFKGRVIFIYADTDVEENDRISDYFGLTKSELPSYRMIELAEEMVKFKPAKADFSETAVKEFVKGVLDGTIKPHLNSQQLPEDWDKNPVKVLVGSNFKEIARNPEKAVFVEFYAPWCGHCKQLAPIWDQLGEHYAKHPNIVIAKMDSTANELEDVKITGFPTIKYFPKGPDAMSVDYNGDRTLEAFIRFLDSEGKEGNTRSTKDKAKDEEEDEEDAPPEASGDKKDRTDL